MCWRCPLLRYDFLTIPWKFLPFTYNNTERQMSVDIEGMIWRDDMKDRSRPTELRKQFRRLFRAATLDVDVHNAYRKRLLPR
jgi:hypothetical protein